MAKPAGPETRPELSAARPLSIKAAPSDKVDGPARVQARGPAPELEPAPRSIKAATSAGGPVRALAPAERKPASACRRPRAPKRRRARAEPLRAAPRPPPPPARYLAPPVHARAVPAWDCRRPGHRRPRAVRRPVRLPGARPHRV